MTRKSLQTKEPLTINRKELIVFMELSGSTVDAIIKNDESFPQKLPAGGWPRKAVMDYFKTKGMM